MFDDTAPAQSAPLPQPSNSFGRERDALAARYDSQGYYAANLRQASATATMSTADGPEPLMVGPSIGEEADAKHRRESCARNAEGRATVAAAIGRYVAGGGRASDQVSPLKLLVSVAHNLSPSSQTASPRSCPDSRACQLARQVR